MAMAATQAVIPGAREIEWMIEATCGGGACWLKGAAKRGSCDWCELSVLKREFHDEGEVQ
jgi:hypothetical protein